MSIEAIDTLQVFKYHSNVDVRVAGTPENPLFCAKDVCLILGLENVSRATGRLKPDMKQKMKVQSGGGKQFLIFINTIGLKVLLSTTIKHVPDEFLSFIDENFNINIDVIIPRKEAHYLSVITYALADYEVKLQHKVGNYFIDLVFPLKRIAVECDENGHSHYDLEKEVQRQRFLEGEGYQFVRFDPDSPSFNIGKVIHQIRRLLADCVEEE